MALFVFGAGATRGASYVDPRKHTCLPPLDRDFFTQLQRIGNPKHKTLITDVLKDVIELFGANFDSTMETVFTTLEHTIRMIKTTRENRDFKLQDLEAKRDRLQQSIAAVLEESLTSKKGRSSSLKARECRQHRDFVERVLKHKDTIISFNYDCLLDFTLKRRGSHKWNAHYGYGFNLGPKGGCARIS